MKKFAVILCVLLSVLCVSAALADVDLENDIKDPEFRYYLSLKDWNRDGILDDGDLHSFSWIELRGDEWDISSLEGIKLLPYLTKLELYEMSSLTALDLSGCTSLNELLIEDCGVTSLDLSGDTALTSAKVSGCKLKSLNVTGCTALRKLVCNNGLLKTLDVTSCTDLNVLDCWDNDISKLDITKCTGLDLLESWFGTQGSDARGIKHVIDITATAEQAASQWAKEQTMVRVNGVCLYPEVRSATAIYKRWDNELYLSAEVDAGSGLRCEWKMFTSAGNSIALWNGAEHTITRFEGDLVDWLREGEVYLVVRDETGENMVPAKVMGFGPKIIKEPDDMKVAAGKEAVFTVEAEGDGELHYQWEVSSDWGMNWSECTGNGADTASLTVKAEGSMNNWIYQCWIQDDYDAVVCMYCVLSVTPGIIEQPEAVIAAAGETVSFSVKADGGSDLTWQWQVSKDGGETWSKCSESGAKTATISLTPSLSYSGRAYRCVVKDPYGGSATSEAATLTVHKALKISTQPADVAADAGTNAKFTVKAAGDDLKYLWQMSKDEGVTWAKTTAAGYNTATLTIPATLTKNGYRYQCVITDAYGGSVTSDAVTLTVRKALKISTQPADVTADTGTNATFTVKAAGDGLTYQWQVLKTADGTWAKTSETGSTAAKLTIAVTAAKNGWQYRCVVKDQYGRKVTSEAAALTVRTALKITAQPANATAAAGTDAKFTVKAAGDGLTYQWQVLKT
ncbi:MAG: hypothetical protein Q4G19_09200, partial [Clostridia bacterium]|nr:hypothetical protein [Clostridia bacterium]